MHPKSSKRFYLLPLNSSTTTLVNSHACLYVNFSFKKIPDSGKIAQKLLDQNFKKFSSVYTFCVFLNISIKCKTYLLKTVTINIWIFANFLTKFAIFFFKFSNFDCLHFAMEKIDLHLNFSTVFDNIQLLSFDQIQNWLFLSLNKSFDCRLIFSN